MTDLGTLFFLFAIARLRQYDAVKPFATACRLTALTWHIWWGAFLHLMSHSDTQSQSTVRQLPFLSAQVLWIRVVCSRVVLHNLLLFYHACKVQMWACHWCVQ